MSARLVVWPWMDACHSTWNSLVNSQGGGNSLDIIWRRLSFQLCLSQHWLLLQYSGVKQEEWRKDKERLAWQLNEANYSLSHRAEQKGSGKRFHFAPFCLGTEWAASWVAWRSWFFGFPQCFAYRRRAFCCPNSEERRKGDRELRSLLKLPHTAPFYLRFQEQTHTGFQLCWRWADTADGKQETWTRSRG